MTKYGSGDLNPQARALVTREYTSDSTFDTFIRDAAARATQEDIFANAGPFKAEVLRVWKEDGTNINSGFWTALFDDGVEGEIIFIKARIPEIHTYPVDTDDVKSIEMHPTFVSKKPGMTEPQVGTIVWVDYEDRRNLTFPIYLGPVNSTDDQVSQQLNEALRLRAKELYNNPASPRKPFIFGGGNHKMRIGDLTIQSDDVFMNLRTNKPSGYKRKKPPDTIIIHESAAGRVSFDAGKIPDGGRKLTHKTLEKKTLGVHFGVDRYGKVFQSADPVHRVLSHASPYNDVSVAIEIYNPFNTGLASNYKNTPEPTDIVMPATPLHGKGGQILIPSRKQLESAYKLIIHITSTIPSIPLGFPALDSSLIYTWGNIEGLKPGVSKGVIAHGHFHHGDGKVIEFYSILRIMGMSPDNAWSTLMGVMGESVDKGKKLKKTNLVNYGGTIAQAFEHFS